MDQRPLGAGGVAATQSSRLHLAFRVGAAGAETPVNLAWSRRDFTSGTSRVR